MQHKMKILMTALAAGTTLATAAWAQFGGQPFPGGPGGMAPGGQFGGGPNPPGGPFGGPSGMMAFAFGKIGTVDAAAETITLTPQPGEATGQTVKLTGKTRILAQIQVSLSELKIGDRVQVHGVPTGIAASQITAGDETSTVSSSPFGGPSPFGMGGPNGGPSVGAAAASAQASGKITRLSPLTIAVSNTTSLTITAAPSLKVGKTISETLGDLKAGDHLSASGLSDAAGVLTADHVQINMGSPDAPGTF